MQLTTWNSRVRHLSHCHTAKQQKWARLLTSSTTLHVYFKTKPKAKVSLLVINFQADFALIGEKDKKLLGRNKNMVFSWLYFLFFYRATDVCGTLQTNKTTGPDTEELILQWNITQRGNTIHRDIGGKCFHCSEVSWNVFIAHILMSV